MKKNTALMVGVVIFLCAGFLHAANGDLTVTGNAVVNGAMNIGTANPYTNALNVGGVAGNINASIYGYNAYSAGYGVYGNGQYGVYGNGGTVGLYGNGYSTGVIGYSATGMGVRGIGTTYNFYASGPGIAYGTGSSIRWKSNIKSIDNALAKVMSLRGVHYDLDKEHGNRHDIGFIGEEVAQVLPEITGADPDAPGYVTGMDYSKMTPLLLEAIKDQQVEIRDLQQQLADLLLLVTGKGK